MTARRLILATLLAAVACALPATAPAATRSTASVRFSFLPVRAVQGNTIAVTVSVHPAGVRCTLAVKYANGASQPGLDPVVADGGHATWRWQVPENAAGGRARVTASCGRAGTISRHLMIVGWVIPARIDVVKDGFSIRPSAYTGTNVSYGVMLQNVSPNQDALNITVLVNFVMADNHLIGSASSTVGAIPAGTTYALGGDLSFPGAAPVDRLEVVVQIGARAPRSLRRPALSAVHVEADPYDLGWVGSVAGELINDAPGLVLQNARLSAVVFDAAGNVIGGGTGYAFASLPPGSREVFKLQTGFRSIPMTKAADVAVSVEPTYRPVGT